jgi:hypothetical protein
MLGATDLELSCPRRAKAETWVGRISHLPDLVAFNFDLSD